MKAWIEKRLIDGGVKREHIAFMRDNKAHSKKKSYLMICDKAENGF